MKIHSSSSLGTARPAGRRRGAFLALCALLLATHAARAQTFALGTTNLLEGAAAGVDSVVLAVSPSASSWSATANDSWLHVDANNSAGTGSLNVVFSFDANVGGARTGALTIAGQTLSVTQAGAAYVAASSATTLVAAGLNQPFGVAVDGAGNVYFADTANGAIKEWSLASGMVTTLIASGLRLPHGVAVDGQGNLYIADTSNNAIKKWTAADQTIETLVSGLKSPHGVAVDGAGNVYIADTSNNAIKKWTAANQTVETLVSGLNSPLGVAVDVAGNVYFADYLNKAIKQWAAATHTVATLVSAGLGAPAGVAVDGAGNVYFADWTNNLIQVWTAATGTVTTLVSSGLSNPWGVAVDDAGNVYFADKDHDAIKELPRAFLDPTARRETVFAGSDVLPAVLPLTENLPPPFAPTSDQAWLTVSGVTNGVVGYTFTGNVGYGRTGHINVFGINLPIFQAGPFTAALNTNSLSKTAAAGTDTLALTVSSPSGPWTATANAFWLHLSPANQSGTSNATLAFAFDANPGPPRTSSLTVAGQTLTVTQFGIDTLGASSLLEGPTAGSDSVVLARWASFNAWTAQANDPWLHLSPANQSGQGSANVWLSFDANPGITRTGTLTIAGQTLTVVQAGAAYVAASPVTTLVPSELKIFSGAEVDAAGNVYFVSTNNAIRKWTAATQTLTTLVAAGVVPLSVLAVDGAGNVYIADTQNNVIQKWTAATGALTTLVSAGLPSLSGAAVDGAGNLYIADYHNNALQKWTAATGALATLVPSGLNAPNAVAVDSAGNVYIAGSGNGTIRKWTAATQTVTTLISSGVNYTCALAVDGAGNVYIADNENGAIRKWTAATQTLTLLAYRLYLPSAVAVDAAGNVYIADSGNSAIKELPRAFVDPGANLEPAAAGSDILRGVLPAAENLAGPFAPTSGSDWLAIVGVTNGVVTYSFTANTTGAARTGQLTVLGIPIPVTQAGLPLAPTLIGAGILTNRVFQFNFTGTPGASYTVLATTNLALPVSSWTVAGPAVELSVGQFRFTASPTPGGQQRFFQVRCP